MIKKYRCLGGWISSRSDGERHFISATRVAELYGVNPAECIFVNPDDHPDNPNLLGCSAEMLASLVDLWPRDDGNYALEIKL